MKGDRLATARSGIQSGCQESDGELAALAKSTALEIERNGDGRDAGADLGLAEFNDDAEERVARGCGEDFKTGFLFWRHASRGVSKAERPTGKGFRPGVCGLVCGISLG